MPICSRCGKPKLVSEFGIRNDRKQKRRGVCTTCTNESTRETCRKPRSKEARQRYAASHLEERRRWSKESYKNRREWMDELKSKPCADCEQTFPPYCMDWDHVRGKKSFNVGEAISLYSKERIMKEIEKCDLVCANCHRIRTHKKKEQVDKQSLSKTLAA